MHLVDSFVGNVRSILIVGRMSGEANETIAKRLSQVSFDHRDIPADFRHAFVVACILELTPVHDWQGTRPVCMN